MTRMQLITLILQDKRTAAFLSVNDLQREKKAYLEVILENIQDDGSKKALAERIVNQFSLGYSAATLMSFRKSELEDMVNP